MFLNTAEGQEIMKISLFILLLFIFCLFSCAKEKQPVEPTHLKLQRMEANMDTIKCIYEKNTKRNEVR
jgi:hypothetical protein